MTQALGLRGANGITFFIVRLFDQPNTEKFEEFLSREAGSVPGYAADRLCRAERSDAPLARRLPRHDAPIVIRATRFMGLTGLMAVPDIGGHSRPNWRPLCHMCVFRSTFSNVLLSGC
jgi:hypothetical protein